MNKRYMLDTIFESAHFEVHPEFIEEFLSLINKSSDKNLIIKNFEKLLYAVNNLGFYYMCNHKKIEKLKDCNNLYSLRIITKNSNFRVLFSVMKSSKILLHTFYEKEGKDVTEYQSHIPIAEARLENF